MLMFYCFFLFLSHAQGPSRGIEFLRTSLGNASGQCEGECIRWTGTNSWLPTCDSQRTARTAGSSSGKNGLNMVVWCFPSLRVLGPDIPPPILNQSLSTLLRATDVIPHGHQVWQGKLMLQTGVYCRETRGDVYLGCQKQTGMVWGWGNVPHL